MKPEFKCPALFFSSIYLNNMIRLNGTFCMNRLYRSDPLTMKRFWAAICLLLIAAITFTGDAIAVAVSAQYGGRYLVG